jgi:hypothetical protein
MKKGYAAVCLLTMLLGNASAATESLDKLAGDFWAWRAKYAPFTGDDVNRIERLGGVRDWSVAAMDKQRKDLAEFEARWKKIDVKGWAVPKQVDYGPCRGCAGNWTSIRDGNAIPIFTSLRH